MRYNNLVKKMRLENYTPSLGKCLEIGIEEIRYSKATVCQYNFVVACLVLWFKGLISKQTAELLKRMSEAVGDTALQPKKNMFGETDESILASEVIKKVILQDYVFKNKVCDTDKFQKAIDALDELEITIPRWIYKEGDSLFEYYPEIVVMDDDMVYYVDKSEGTFEKNRLFDLYMVISRRSLNKRIEGNKLCSNVKNMVAFDLEKGIIYIDLKEDTYMEYHINSGAQVFKKNRNIIGKMASGGVLYQDTTDDYIYMDVYGKITQIKPYSFSEKYICDYHPNYMLVKPRGNGGFFKPYKLYPDRKDKICQDVDRDVVEMTLWQRLVANVIWRVNDIEDYEISDMDDVIDYRIFFAVPDMTAKEVKKAFVRAFKDTSKLTSDPTDFYRLLTVLKKGLPNVDILDHLYVTLDYTVQSNCTIKLYRNFPSFEVVNMLEKKYERNKSQFSKLYADASTLVAALERKNSSYVKYDIMRNAMEDTRLTYTKMACLYDSAMAKRHEIHNSLHNPAKIYIGGYYVEEEDVKIKFTSQNLLEGRRIDKMSVPTEICEGMSLVIYNGETSRHVIHTNHIPTEEEIEGVMEAFEMAFKPDIVVEEIEIPKEE